MPKWAGASVVQSGRKRMRVGAIAGVVMGVVGVVAAHSRAQPTPSAFSFTTLAGDAARSSVGVSPAGLFSTVRFTATQTPELQAIQFVGPSGVAATALPAPRVFTFGKVGSQTRAFAINAETGQIAWQAPLPNLILDSWSCPTVNAADTTVLFPVGSTVTALRQSDGSVAWQTPLPSPPINVSPIVTNDLSPRTRVLVTGYGGFGDPTDLYCINASPRHEVLNPYNPGELLWSAPIGSATGATPAYLDGVLYVASSGLDSGGHGEIRAFDLRTVMGTTPPEPLWTFSNPAPQSFFGGLTVRETPSGTFVYAATYATFGGLDSANLVKVDAATGVLVWSVACNRTDSIPVVLADGRIALSTGIHGFGSMPMLQLFEDHGASASLAWSSAAATWNDSNANGTIDLGEYLLIGGWTTQPILALDPVTDAATRLVIGAIPSGASQFGAYTTLYEVDLDRHPSQVGFIVQSTPLAGSTAAMLGKGVYSIGTSGLSALGIAPPRGDLHADGRLTIDDLAAWEQNPISRDVDRNGVSDQKDRETLLRELRRNEHRNLLRDRSVRRP